ncbi:DUF1456 family protein [Sansalvadorimonas sp. 2012CJ34-2]|uniref:DUF1456 family protein n=1 Tax=Parendozoicomonas callyspongiae TaxID=2942213 RepID=A0ABT0PL30_9GAMM|nr:DUF1456 family protein [Sansalvadorimonas sp. 2012CJ34-2]MCL6272087.1 DUF1456 family protein [Sansalvadorimonas sp. 2012CJ34-2]
MIANDVLRRLRFALNLSDKEMVAIFKLADHDIPVYHLYNLMRKEDEKGYVLCHDDVLARFLDGLIIHRRGKQEGRETDYLPKGQQISKNEILRKLRIALELKDSDIIDMMKLADFRVTKAELSAIFRRKGHRNYKECGNQFLRNFISGLTLKLRKDLPPKKLSAEKEGRKTVTPKG